jgi:hypothetical protein
MSRLSRQLPDPNRAGLERLHLSMVARWQKLSPRGSESGRSPQALATCRRCIGARLAVFGAWNAPGGADGRPAPLKSTPSSKRSVSPL